VKSGDTLGVIAARFKTTVQAIMALNASVLTDQNRIQVGQKLLISGTQPTTATQVPTDTPPPTQDSSSDAALASSDATQVPTWTPLPTSTSIPTWTPVPTQVYYYQAPIQPAPRTKSS
jgi:LysM repeat protein